MRSGGSPASLGPFEFEIIFICTGNRARSPVAAELFRRHFVNLPVTVNSLGTLDLGRVPALPEAVWAAEMLGVDISSHRARPLRPRGLESTNLVIGFETFHVAAAVVEGGAPRERVFLITELAELLGQIGTSRDSTPEQAIELAHAGRAEGSPSTLPIRDPVGKSVEDFRTTFEQISNLVEAIAVGLFGDAVAKAAPASRRRH